MKYLQCPMCDERKILHPHHLINTTLAERVAGCFISAGITGKSLQKITSLVHRVGGTVKICDDCHRMINKIYSQNLNNLEVTEK